MKYRKIKYLIIVFLAIVLIPFNNVKASEKVSLKIDKKDLEVGDEITVSASISSDLDAYALLATLKYDKNVFKKIDDSNFSVDELSSVTYNEDTNKFGIINKSGKIAMEDGTLFTVHLKVKDDASVGDTNIALTNITYSDGKSKKTLDKVSTKVSVTKDAKDGEVIPQNKENKITEDKEEVILVFPTSKVIILLSILAFILLIVIIYINFKTDTKKKSLHYLIGIEVIIILLIILLFIININKKDVNRDGKKDYKDAEEIIDYLINIEGTKPTATNIDNNSKNKTSVGRFINYDTNNDGRVDIGDAGYTVESITKGAAVSLSKVKEDETDNDEYYVEKGKIILKFKATINPSDLKITKVKIGNKYYNVEYKNGVYSVLVDNYNKAGPHDFVINGVKLSNGEERDTNLVITKEILKDVPEINIENKQGKYEDMNLKFDLDDKDKSLTSAEIVIFKGKVTEEEIKEALEGSGVLDQFDEEGNKIESDDFDNFEEIYEESFNSLDFPVTLNLKDKKLELGGVYTVVVFGEYDLDSNHDNKKNNYKKEIIKDSPKTITVGNLKIKSESNETIYLKKNEEYKFKFDASFEPEEIKKSIVRATVDGEEKTVEIENDSYFINLTAVNSQGSKTFHISEVLLEDGTKMLCDYDIKYEVLKDEPEIKNFTYHKKDNKITFTLEDLDEAATEANIKITNKKENKEIFKRDLDLNDKKFSFDNINIKEGNVYNVEIDYSYDLDNDTTNKVNNYKKTFKHELKIFDVNLDFDKKIYYVEKGNKDVTLKFNATIEPESENAKVTKININGENLPVISNADGSYSVTVKGLDLEKTGKIPIKINKVIIDENVLDEDEIDEEDDTDISLEVEVLKDQPTIEDLLIDETEGFPIVEFTIKDPENTLEDNIGKVIISNEGNVVEEFDINTYINDNGKVKIKLDDLAEKLEAGGSYNLDIKVNYDLDSDKKSEDNKQKNYALIDTHEFKIYIAELIQEKIAESKYANKNEKIPFYISSKISPSENIKSFVLDDDTIIPTSIVDGLYYIELDEETTYGIKNYTIQKIILENDIVIKPKKSLKLNIDILKDMPYVNKLNLSEKNDFINYELLDDDHAFISGKITIYDKTGTKIKEEDVQKTGTGVIQYKFIDGDTYTVKVTGSYDLDSIENGPNEKTDVEMSSESFVVGGDYNFKLTNASITDSLQPNEKPIVSFKSTNTRGSIVTKANLTNDNGEPIEYSVRELSKDNYEITLDDAKMAPGRHTVTLDSVSMDNSLKTFENKKDYNTNKFTYTVLKEKPKVEGLSLTNNKDDKIINATFKLVDEFKSTNKLTVVLVDSANKTISTHEIKKEDLNFDDNINVSLSYNYKTNASTAEGYYTVKVLADYDLADQYKYKNISLSEEGILTTTENDIYIQDMYITNNNNQRLDNNVYQAKGEQNFQIAFVIHVGDSVKNIAKEKWGTNYNYNNLQSVTINGLNYPATGIRSDANSYTVKAKLTVPNKAGIFKIKASRVQLGITGYYNMTKTDWYSVADRELTIDILKDKPKIENLIITDDYDKQEAKFDFDVVLDETEEKENFTGNIKLGDSTDTIKEGHNTKIFTNITQNENLDLIITGDYDLDTDKLDSTPDDKNSFKDEVLYEDKYGLYDQNTYNNISIQNDKIISEKENKYFEKNEKIKLKFDISGIPESLEALREKVIIDSKEYPLNVVDGSYELILDGYNSSGEKSITVTDIILSNGKKVTLQNPHKFKPEVLKDVPTIDDFTYEVLNDKVKVTLDLKDYDNSLIGKCRVIITDEKGIEVYNEELKKEFTFNHNKNNLRYYIKVINDYDRDIYKKKDSDNYNKDVTLLDEIISLEENNIELKDITDISLYKSDNDKITLEDTVNIDNLEKEKDKYFVEISMESLPTARAKIDEIIKTDDTLTLVLKYEYVTKEGAKAKKIKVVYGSITGKNATNETHPADAFKALLLKLQAGNDVELSQNYDASSIEDTDDVAYVTTEYNGTLKGNGYTIKNLSKPLFNKIIKDGKVDNLILKDVNLGTKGKGALANQTNGAKVSNIIVNNVTKTGAEDGQNGGLIGLAKENTIIENCGVKNANLNVSGNNKQQNGGLAGCTENSTVTNSYATGKVYNGANFTASLVGNALGSIIKNCYTNVTVSGAISCDLACSYNNASTYINNVALGTGSNKGFANSNQIRKAENNYYVKDGESDVNGVNHITKYDVNKKLFSDNALFDDDVWLLNDDISYENNPILQMEKVSNLTDTESDGYDESKETLYANLLKLMPYYDSDKIIESGSNINDELLTNQVLTHVAPVDVNGNLVTYLTTDNPKKITKIKLIFKNGESKVYNVTYEKTYDMVATYKILELGIDYNYNHYVINSSSQVVNNLTNYLKDLDYTDNLDTLTTNADSRIYRDFYNETTKNELKEFVLKYLSNSNYTNTLDDDAINNYIEREVKKNQKIEKALYVYNYFRRFYDLDIEGMKVYDFVMFNMQGFYEGLTFDKIVELYLGDYSGSNFDTSTTDTKYNNIFSSYTGYAHISNLLEYLVTHFSDKDMNEWTRSQFKGILEEIPVKGHEKDIQYTLWDHFSHEDDEYKNNSYRVYNFVLPILTLPDTAAYIISAPAQFTIGAQRVYMKNPNNPDELKEFREKMNVYVERITSYYNTAYSILQDSKIFNDIHLYQVDKRTTKDETGAGVYNNPYSTEEPFHKNFDEVVNIWPANYGVNAGNWGDRIEWNVAGFMDSNIKNDGKTDEGHPTWATWSHETAHYLDDRLFFKDKDRRFDAGGEDYADEFLMQKFGLGVVMNLSIKFNSDAEVATNLNPSRIDSPDKIKDFYRKMYETIYAMDYIEAQAFLKLTPEEMKEIGVQVSYPNQEKYTSEGSKYRARETSRFTQLSEISNFDYNKLKTMDDLIDNNIMIYPGIYKVGSRGNNSYGGEGINVVHWYQPNNPDGRPDSYSLKWFSYEMLGYAGYDKGFIEFASNSNPVSHVINNDVNDDSKGTKNVNNYKSDDIAIRRISDNTYQTIDDYKKARFLEVSTKLKKLRTEVNIQEYAQEFYDALVKDVKEMKQKVENRLNSGGGEEACLKNYWCYTPLFGEDRSYPNSTKVRKEFYFKLKRATNDFNEEIYLDNVNQDITFNIKTHE